MGGWGMQEQVRHHAWLIGVCAILFSFQLGVPRLWDDDEAYFAQCAWEMLERDNWFVPYFNGEVFVDKPPVMYWGMMAAYAVFGATEFAARIPSAVCGLLNVLLTYYIGRRLFDPRVAFWGALILASSLNFNVIVRAATPDSELTLFCMLALALFIWRTAPRTPAAPNSSVATDSVLTLKPTFATWALVYAAMGGAVLVKGPIGVMIPTAILGYFLLWTTRLGGAATLMVDASPRGLVHQYLQRSWDFVRTLLSPRHVLGTIWSMRPLTALAMVLLVAGPWYVTVSIQTDGYWPAKFFGVHNFDRFLHTMESHRGPIFYYVIAMVIGIFPWSIFAVPTGIYTYRRLTDPNPDQRQRSVQFLVSWLFVWVGFFSLAGTKLPSYVIPAYPAATLLLACFVCDWLKGREEVRAWVLRCGWISAMLVGIGLAIAGPIIGERIFGGDVWLGLVGLPPLAGGALALVYTQRGMSRRALQVYAAAACVFLLTTFGFALVRVDRHQNSQFFANQIRAHATETPTIATFGYFRPSLVAYARQPVIKLQSAEAASEYFDKNQHDSFLLISDEAYARVGKGFPADVAILEQSRKFGYPGQILLLGRPHH